MTLYIDLDGVLADMEKGVLQVTGKSIEEHYSTKQGTSAMWKKLAYAPSFFTKLDWMSDGVRLWDYVKVHSPTILTGVAFGNWSSPQKKAWCLNKLGTDVKVITCWSKDKHLHCQSGDILVDDRESAAEPWEKAGGIFIHHTTSNNSVDRLRSLGY